MATTLINPDLLKKALHAHIQAEMHEAAEKTIKEAVEKYEAEVRSIVAKSILTVLDRTYEVTNDRDRMVIMVRHREFS